MSLNKPCGRTTYNTRIDRIMYSTAPMSFCSGCLSLLDVFYPIHSAGVTIEWFKTWALGSGKCGFKFQPCLANFSKPYEP